MRLHTITALIAMSLLVAASPAAGVSTGRMASGDPQDPPQAARAEVFQRLGLNTGADYVIVLDGSGSMASHRTEVMTALRAFLDGVRLVDRVALVSFSSPAPTTSVYSLARLYSAEDLLSRVPFESGQTDIGGGLSKGLEELESSTEVRPAAIILITDAEQTTEGTTTPEEWDELAERVDRLRARQVGGVRQIVRGYVLSWGGGESASSFQAGTSCTADSSYTIAQCVFSPEETSRILPVNAPAFLSALPETFADRRFEALLADDARAVREGSAVTVKATQTKIDPSDRTAEVRVEAASSTRHLPLRICDLTAIVPGLNGMRATAASPACLDLAPGTKKVTARITLSWQPGERPWYAMGTPAISGRGTLSYTLTSPYSDLMSRSSPAGHFSPRVRPAELTLSAPATTGQHVGLLVLLSLSILVIIRLAGLPTTVWVVDGTGRVPLRVWRPKGSYQVRPDTDLTVTTAWKPWRLLSGGGPLEVVVWPNGTQGHTGPIRARHRVDLRRYGRQVAVPALPGTTMSRGRWLRPGRPAKATASAKPEKEIRNG